MEVGIDMSFHSMFFKHQGLVTSRLPLWFELLQLRIREIRNKACSYCKLKYLGPSTESVTIGKYNLFTEY